MPELNEEMFKKFVFMFVTFIILASTLFIFYDIVITGVNNALTGNIVWDGIISIIPIAFGAGVIMIVYKYYIPKNEGD